MARTSLKSLCRALPAATEDIKWEKNQVFSVGGKMFAVFHVENEKQVSFKVSPQNFAMLTKQPGIVPAPYLAWAKWVLVEDMKAIPATALKELLRESHRLVAEKLPAAKRRKLEFDDEPIRTRRAASSPSGKRGRL